MLWGLGMEVRIVFADNGNGLMRIYSTLGDSVGGDMYWATGVSIIGPLPWKPHWPLKTHMFVNAGRLDSYNVGKRRDLVIAILMVI
jgi:outer membrane protein assembly factor BamA